MTYRLLQSIAKTLLIALAAPLILSSCVQSPAPTSAPATQTYSPQYQQQYSPATRQADSYYYNQVPSYYGSGPSYQYQQPASRAYSNPYAFPPQNQYPYYDGDQYYVPPANYGGYNRDNSAPTNQKF